MKTKDFDFENYLTENGYVREEILGAEGMIYCVNFQKEVRENEHNALTLLPIGIFSAASTDSEIKYSQEKFPTSESEAKKIISEIEA